MPTHVNRYQEKPTESFRAVRWLAGDAPKDLAGLVPEGRWRVSADGKDRIEILIDAAAPNPFWMPLEPGDWLCLWENGNFGIFCAEEFEDQYERVRP